MPEEEIDLRELINVLLKRKWLIIGIFLVAIITAVIISYFVLPQTYRSSATFMIAQINGTPLYDIGDIENKIKSDNIIQKVIDRLGIDTSTSNFMDSIKIENIDRTKYIKITNHSDSSEKSRNIVLSVIDQFIEENQLYYLERIRVLEEEKELLERQVAMERDKIDQAEKLRLDIIDSEGLSLTEKQIQINLLLNYSTEIREHYNDLVEQLYTLEEKIINSNNFEIMNYPTINDKPIKPNKKLNIAIGGVLGLFMGIFIAFFLEFWQAGKE
jgi:uncharacterized protein involved in exopolysaccharide biosynthesis